MGGDTKGPAHHVIFKLSISGGFLGGAKFDLADGLNCFIGGRGTGKTTALELMRFALGLMPDAKVNAARARAIETLVKANLGDGRIAVELSTKTGMRYTAERGASDAVQVTNEAGKPVPVQLDRDQIFAADVFSQNEIEEIATNPAAQLVLLDRFVDSDAMAIARELEGLSRQVGDTSIELQQLDREIEDLVSRASEVPVLEEKLKGFVLVGGPDAAKINAAHTAKTARERESLIPTQLIETTQRVARTMASAVVSHQATVAALLDSEARTGINSDLFVGLTSDLQSYERSLLAASSAVADAAATTVAAIHRHNAEISERHATQESDYRTLVATSEQEGGRASERAQLQKIHAAATDAAKQKEAKEAHRATVMAKRTALLHEISELRDRRYTARAAVAERLTQRLQCIRVTVLQSADARHYRELVASALKGSAMRQNVVAERLTELFLPGELASAVLARDVAVIAEKTAFDEERARRVVDALRSDGAVYKLEAVDLEDVPRIELLDGDKYKESQNLSTGQRCTTILPILLVQSERPLLIDQPEDNLDNAFIYATVVKALKEVRGKRQVIFVTHNPNIPVLGEADRVFVLESDGEQATVRRVGTVDECKDDIETILEGGPEAFLERKRRYGH